MKPINNHVRIQPLEQDAFIMTQKTSYEEIGTVLDVAEGVNLPIGARVYFDGWLAKKYPVSGSPGEFNWFVDYADIVAVDYETKVPE